MDRTVPIISQEKIFKAILSLPENKFCADCRSLHPDWVSLTLGVFVCYKCSGTHRSFGSHITRVKSTTLDKWTIKQIYIMGTISNDKSNQYWEANIPQDFDRPNFDSSSSDLASFAKKKYIEKAFLAPNTVIPAEEASKDFELDYDHEGGDKDAFCDKKLEELKDILRSKVSSLSPEAKQAQNRTPRFRTGKKATTVIITDKTFSDAVRSATPGKSGKKKNPFQFSPLLPSSKRVDSISFFNDSQPSSKTSVSSTANLPLFKGLNLKTQTSIVEDLSETSFKKPLSRALTKCNTYGSESTLFTGRFSHQPSIATSKNLEVSSKPKLINYFSESVFEESRGPSPKQMEIEMHDMSNTSLHQEFEEGFLGLKSESDDYKSQNRKKSSKDSWTSLGLRLSNVGEPHLKRPSEAFEIPKSLIMQNVTSARLKWWDRMWKYPVFLGCFLLHLLIGYFYCWGSISPYISSFVMSDYQDDRYIEHASHNMMIFLGVAMGFCLCEKLANAVGMRILVFGSFLGLGGTIFLCSFTDDVLMYSGLLTIVPGFFIGLTYDVPYHVASQYFLSQQVFLKGFFYLTNGLGAAAYIFFSYYYLRFTQTGAELNTPPLIDSNTSSFYSNELAQQVPNLLRHMSYAILAIGLLGTILIQPRGSFIIRDWAGIKEREESLLAIQRRTSTSKKVLKRKVTNMLRQGLKEALISPNTKILLLTIMGSFVLSSFLLYSYKDIGIQQGYSDLFMSIAGCIGMISLGAGKVVGVVIHPKQEFKALIRKIIRIQACAGIALFLMSKTIPITFMPIFFVIMFLDGLLFSLVIEETKFVYLEDIEDQMVALMWVGYAIANFLSFIIMKCLLLLQLKVAVFLVLSLPLFLAYNVSKQYSRATTGNDTEMVSLLLAV